MSPAANSASPRANKAASSSDVRPAAGGIGSVAATTGSGPLVTAWSDGAGAAAVGITHGGSLRVSSTIGAAGCGNATTAGAEATIMVRPVGAFDGTANHITAAAIAAIAEPPSQIRRARLDAPAFVSGADAGGSSAAPGAGS